MPKCDYKDCKCEATHSVTLNVPAEGVPIDLHRPLKMFLGIELCFQHATEFGKNFSWEENEHMKEAIDASLAVISSTKADYPRTFHSIIKLNDAGYLQFLDYVAHKDDALLTLS